MNKLKMKKFSLFALVVALVLAATCLFALPTEANAASTMTLSQLQEKFPSGKYWNHYVSSVSNCGDSLMSRGDESFANSVSSTPCASHSATSASYYVGKYDCNFFNGGIQCFGFARKLGYDAFGTKVSTWPVHSSIASIKPGDVVRFWSPVTDQTNGHTVFVTAISGTTITVGEANVDGSPCKIRWGHQYNLSSAWKVEVYSAPGTLSNYSGENLGDDFYARIKHPTSGNYVCHVGTNVELGNSGNNRSRWRFIRQSDGSYKIYSCLDNGLIDVLHAKTEDGTNISICEFDSGSDAQKWNILKIGQKCSLITSLCGKAMDLTSGQSMVGTNIQLYTQNGTDAQLFTIIKICSSHSYSSKVTKSPTCTATGVRTYTCSVCGEIKSETIAATGHNYATATCTAAKACTVCGTTSGSNLGHSYTNACDTSCNRCGATRTVTHSYANATCTKAKTCSICGVTSGSSLGHSYTNACDTSCNRCGATRTIVHAYKAATCTAAKTCKICGTTSGSSLGHSYTNACDTSCNRCGATRTVTHSYAAATCTKAKTCKVCGATSGKKLGHDYTNSCDTKCNRCNAKRSITHKYTAKTCGKTTKCSVCGKKGGKLAHSYDNACDTKCNRCGDKRTIKHTYKTTVTKATLKKNGKEVKACTVCGKVSKETTIYKIKTVKLSTTEYTYNGKAKKPSVTVKDSKGNKLKEGTDYTVTYDSGRKKVGEYDVKVKFKGDYSGSKTLTFEINPKGTTVSKLTAKSKALTVKLNKQTTQTTGYQIQYSTDKDFDSAKKVTVSSNKTTSKTIKSLKKKKKYYVRVRTYKTVDGVKYYSNWSSAKSMKTK